MKKELTRIVLGVFILAMLFTSVMGESPIAFATDGTVKIYIGDSTTARHHMAMVLGSTSEEYSFELKGYEVESSVYSSSNPSSFKIQETGNGKCKVVSVAEGTGLVTLTIKTTDKKTLTEKVFVSVYTKIEECQAKAIKVTDVYRGATSNAGVENEDKKGTLSKDEQVTVIAECNDYYLFRTNDGSTYLDDKDTGFVKKSDLNILVSTVTIQEQNISLKIDDNKKLNAKVTPDIATNPGLSWETGSEKIASVNSSGKVTGKAEGTTSITATSKDGSNKKGTTYVSVYKEIGEVGGYIKSDASLYAIGNNKNLIGTGKVGTNLTIIGTCGNYYYIKIDKNLINKEYNGVCYILKSNVTIPVTSIKLNKNKASLSPKEKIQLSATVMPSMADNKKVKWSSSNSKIAVVNDKGYVTAKKVGKAIITATSVDGSKSDKCEVSVVKNSYDSPNVKSKPSLSVERTGTDSVMFKVYNKNEFIGFDLYVNGKKWDEDFEYVSKRNYQTAVTYGLNINETYKIKVKTYVKNNKKKKYSKFSNTQKVTVGKVDISVNAIKSKSATISWKEVDGADHYNIYRAGTKKGNYKLIKTVKGNKAAYTDKNVKLNKTYYYMVKPVNLGGVEGTSNIAHATVSKLKEIAEYLAKKYNTICTDKKKNINSYNIKGTYSPVKYRFAGGTLEIHVYLEFVTYSDTGKSSGDGVKIFKKKKASVKSEISTSKYISMFKKGLTDAYNINVKGGNGNFQKGIKFKTKLVIHDKEKMKKVNSNQKFVEVLIGGECPNCTSKGDHWYHCGPNKNASSNITYMDIYLIYMPTNEQVKANTKKGYNYPADYNSTAAHELGHILGLDDAYYDSENNYDRCADNSETGYMYNKKKKYYDNLMKDHYFYKKINANGIEMMLKAVDENTGIPNCLSQSFNNYGDEEISEVIKNQNDEQIENGQ